jgi:tyrosyl-tRNA synthetase
MYSKLEKIPDTLTEQYFELLTDQALEALPQNPRDRQKELALNIVAQYHGMALAMQTQQALAAVVKQDMSQTEIIPEFSLATVQFPVKLFYLVSASGLCSSSSDARRQIQGGAVRLNGEKITQVEQAIPSGTELEGKVLQVGKKKFIRFVA